MINPLTMSTAEPFFIPGNKTGCLLIHGFTGTPKEMRMLAGSLVSEGYTILGVRLFGHATDWKDMQRARIQDWVASVEDGLNLLKGYTDEQFVMGLSMGGILSMIAAARYPIQGVVSFSTPCSLPQDRRAAFLPLLAHILPTVAKGAPDWRNQDAAKDHKKYPFYPTRSILELQKIIKVMRDELANIEVPALFVQSHGDNSIPAESMDYLYDHISSKDKTKMWVENSGHVVIREPDRGAIFTKVREFIRRVKKTE